MIIDNVVDICVALCIAILGIAYPIIVNNISSIGDKYDSIHIQKLFHSEFPQNRLEWIERKYRLKVTKFELVLFFTLASFILLIFPTPPKFIIKIYILNDLLKNSADLIIIILTILLCIFFFILLKIVYRYSGNANDLLQYLITKYNRIGITDREDYNLKAINEIAIYAIKKDDLHLKKTLLNFYSTMLIEIHNDHGMEQEVRYPEDVYQIFSIINQIAANNERRN